MKLLVTAGNTLVLIDKVRAITNIFTGRTGAKIGLHAQRIGHSVRLLTSHPEVVDRLLLEDPGHPPIQNIHTYRTFEDLANLMRHQIVNHPPDAIVHCAAVNDYQPVGVYARSEGTSFDPESLEWLSDERPTLRDVKAGKVKSDATEIWLRLTKTPKLVDKIRSEWDFHGVLVKFKLEVGVDEAELLERAEKSRVHSTANLMVANTLEDSQDWAHIGPIGGCYQKITRETLPSCLIQEIEKLYQEQTNG
ncbi:MAG: phosphopantothenoylcysteine decarboxylase [Gemmataceae bacterium]